MSRGLAAAQEADERARHRQIVDRHIGELRFRHLEQLTHDIASAILDARLAPHDTPPTRE